MIPSKLATYIGFAIKSGKVIFGYDKLFEARKIPNVVLICSTLNEKNTNKIMEFCNNHTIKYYKLKELVLGEILKRDNCKVIGIIDKNLSNVISNEMDLLNGN